MSSRSETKTRGAIESAEAMARRMEAMSLYNVRDAIEADRLELVRTEALEERK